MAINTIEKRGNDAIAVNYGNTINFAGGTAEIAITTHGSDWYWAVTAVMMVATIAFMGLAYTKPAEKRVFHYLTAAVTMVASIAYFSMASNLGWAPITVEFNRATAVVAGSGPGGSYPSREIFYVRYIDWVLTTPMLLLDLLLTAGLPWHTVFFTVLFDEMMIVTGLAGALTRSSYKWGYYVFGCMALFWIGWILIFEARASSKRFGSDVARAYITCGTWTFFLWCLYPIAWGLSEGGNVIAPDSEAVFYGVLDILAKPIFGALLLWGHRGIDPARLGLGGETYTNDVGVKTTEKNGATNGTNGAEAAATETV